MRKKYDFENLKVEIKELSSAKQLKRLFEAKTEYLQNENPNSINLFEVSFDKKCELEIKKIKEIMKIGLA